MTTLHTTSPAVGLGSAHTTLESMYEWSQHEIKRSRKYKDLIPFVSYLLSVKDIQEMLVSKIDLIYKNTSGRIRQAYLNLASIDQILPPDIILNIIKFFDSSCLSYLPLVSKTFRMTILTNPNLFFDNVRDKRDPHKPNKNKAKQKAHKIEKQGKQQIQLKFNFNTFDKLNSILFGWKLNQKQIYVQNSMNYMKIFENLVKWISNMNDDK